MAGKQFKGKIQVSGGHSFRRQSTIMVIKAVLMGETIQNKIHVPGTHCIDGQSRIMVNKAGGETLEERYT